jgi:2-aminoadipate transaminase
MRRCANGSPIPCHGRTKILPEQILMVSGSQQALDLLGKVLIDEGSRVLVETPSYLGALQAFSVYRPEFASVDTDDDGLVPASIDAVAKGARLLYSLPNFQNPTGRSLSIARRLELVETCARLGLPLIEDDPYGALSYGRADAEDGGDEPGRRHLHGLLLEGADARASASATWCAPLPLVRRLELAKQAADLHTAQLTQMVVHEVVKDGFLDEHIPTIRTLYGNQCQAMLDAMAEHFPASASWTKPEGGMFIWVTLPKSIDAMKLLDTAIASRVAFVPGAPFYANEPETNTLRLSFVTVPPERIREGIAILGKLIAALL